MQAGEADAHTTSAESLVESEICSSQFELQTHRHDTRWHPTQAWWYLRGVCFSALRFQHQSQKQNHSSIARPRTFHINTVNNHNDTTAPSEYLTCPSEDKNNSWERFSVAGIKMRCLTNYANRLQLSLRTPRALSGLLRCLTVISRLLETMELTRRQTH